jgi:AraC-like DNA-binding protein
MAATTAGSHLETSDPDEAVDLLTTVYCPHRMLLGPRAPGFHMRHEQRAMHGVRMMRLRYGGTDVGVEPEPFNDFVLVMRPLSGRFAASRADADVTETRRHALAFDGQCSYRMRWYDECRVTNMLIDRSQFDRAVADLYGTGDAHTPIFDLTRPRSDAAVERWIGIETLLWRELGREESPTPLIHGQLIRLVVAILLENFTVTFTTGQGVTRGLGSHASVRRAMAFVDSHASDDIGLAHIAEAARLSVRGIQDAFRRHLNTTPLGYLRRVRLDHAHQELLASSPSATTVGRIAARWGFANPGRFAAEHRRVYGCEPAAVLRS